MGLWYFVAQVSLYKAVRNPNQICMCRAQYAVTALQGRQKFNHDDKDRQYKITYKGTTPNTKEVCATQRVEGDPSGVSPPAYTLFQ